MIDRIEPLSALVAFVLIIALLLVVGIIRRRREQQRHFEEALARHHDYRARGLCAAVWDEDDTWHVCSMRHEHAGPHLDCESGSVRRRLESFTGGPGLHVHPA